ncbi:MAG TPA: ferrochelatase [Alphaproteobacteria bacterium]|nr:ferrochelatase [Alphaproteobacteria bacterium]
MKTAVVLFNLGGPDSLDAVQPFLRNLFSDPAIISLPNPLRWLIAKLISSRRAKTAQAIYARIGGKSPLRELTDEQARALEIQLGADHRVFVAMRYWHPFADETANAVKAYAPDKIVLLPLYPQYSGTTTGSSFKDWHRAAESTGMNVPTVQVRDYPDHAGYVAALAAQLRSALNTAREKGPFRLLFSAHGLPKKVIDAGDPYQAQIERTAAAVVAALRADAQGLDWRVCYQSRVGPLEWIGPATDDEIKRAGEEALGLVVLPIAFVSEHSETLVELDIEYRELADHHGVPFYIRVPALGTDAGFIAALADLVGKA